MTKWQTTLISLQIVVTCHWAWKMAESQTPSCAPPRSTTTTVDRLTPGLTDDVTADREGPGAQRGKTNVNGFRWTLARSRECHVLRLKEDRTPLSGLKVTIYHIAEMDTSLFLTEKAGVPR